MQRPPLNFLRAHQVAANTPATSMSDAISIARRSWLWREITERLADEGVDDVRLLSPVTTKRGELQDDLAFGNMTQRREIARPRTVKFKEPIATQLIEHFSAFGS